MRVALRRAISVLAVAALMGPGLSPAAIAQAADPFRTNQPDAESAFDSWLVTDLKPQALAAGISEATIDRELAGIDLSQTAVRLDRDQPDDSSTGPSLFSNYLPKRLTPDRIDRGVRKKSDTALTLSSVGDRYGVPPEILLAIWGMETNYGGYTGDFDAIAALATLAFDGRREELFTRELIAALRMIDEGRASRSDMRGSWAGALGNVQFLPTSYLKHAVDADGDGHADIWHSTPDSLASIANYLIDYGWKPGGGWGQAVTVPAGFDRESVRELTRPAECARVLEKHSRWMPISDWKALGFTPVPGQSFPADDTLATLLEVDGPGNGAWLTYGNYRALLGYNCSNFYGLSIGMLADELKAR